MPKRSRRARHFSTSSPTLPIRAWGESRTSSSVSATPYWASSRSARRRASRRVVGHGHRAAERGVAVDHERGEALAGRGADPAELRLRGRRQAAADVRHRSNPRRQPHDLRRARRQLQQPAPTAADQERRVRPLHRFRPAVELVDLVIAPVERARLRRRRAGPAPPLPPRVGRRAQGVAETGCPTAGSRPDPSPRRCRSLAGPR